MVDPRSYVVVHIEDDELLRASMGAAYPVGVISCCQRAKGATH